MGDRECCLTEADRHEREALIAGRTIQVPLVHAMQKHFNELQEAALPCDAAMDEFMSDKACMRMHAGAPGAAGRSGDHKYI